MLDRCRGLPMPYEELLGSRWPQGALWRRGEGDLWRDTRVLMAQGDLGLRGERGYECGLKGDGVVGGSHATRKRGVVIANGLGRLVYVRCRQSV